MAEIWPTLKRKLACDVRRRRKKKNLSSKASASSSSRLEKLAALLKGVHSKSKASQSLVERTGASVSAARSLSRSAQEWTASTLARTASRREGSKSPEIVLLQCSAVSQTRSSEHTERLSCADERFNPRPGGVEEEPSEAAACESSVVGSVERQSGNLSEDRESQTGEKEAAIALPLRKPGRCMKKIRRSLQRNSTSAFVLLLALGASISSRFRKIGNPLAAVLTFNAVVLRVWRRGKLYARFLFSSVALYFLTPLRSYLTYYPRRLSLGQSTDTRTHLSSSQNLDSNLVVLPLEPSAASVAPLSLLLTIPEAPASSATEPTESGAPSPSRRLAKKVSSRFKKLKMFRSSSSSSPTRASSSALSSPSTASSEPGSTASPSAAPSSPCKCPFSRRLHKTKSDIPPEFGDEESKKSRLSRMSSPETLDIGEITASDAPPTPTASSQEAVSWPVAGLLVTLLFLLVGRVPAIMATSLFLVVVSNAHHDRAHPRSRRASEAARKLQPGSPPRRR